MCTQCAHMYPPKPVSQGNLHTMQRSSFLCLIATLVFAACSGDGGPSSSAGGTAGSPDAAGGSGATAGAGGGGGSAGVAGGAGTTAGNAGSAGQGGSAGSSGSAPDGGTGGSQPHAYRCDPVGTAPTDGVFSLRAFADTMYVGLFGYGHESESMLFEYQPWARVQPGIQGVAESICAMIEFQGHLYANTESDGYIYRSADGTHWERVYDGASGLIGCGLEVHDGALYAVNYDYGAHDHGRILRSTDGLSWDVVYDSGSDDLYLRHVVSHGDMLHVLGTRENASEGKMLSSSDGTSWNLTDAPTRFFRALSYDGELYLSSTTSRSNGPAGIWKLGGGTPQMVHAVSTSYVTELAAWDDALWAGTSDGWKDATGSSSLLMSRDGTAWETVCTYPEAAAWAVAPLNDKLYVGTWEYGSHGRLYEVRVTDPGAGGAAGSGGGAGLDCSAIETANPAWDVCESGPDYCAGVYADGAGCVAFCAAAGLTCFAKFGGDHQCVKEPQNVLTCGVDSQHQTDWCECR